MRIADSVALVTGANRGIGQQFTRELLNRGVTKVYATARDPRQIQLDDPRAHVLTLDITDPKSIAAVATVATDVDLLINNAGIATLAPLITGSLEDIRRDMETHFFGTLQVTRAFAPLLARNGGGAILTMLSALSWFSAEGLGSYAAAKSAMWSLTNGIRIELAGQGTLVTGLHVGNVNTDMTAGHDVPNKADPADVASAGLDALEAGDMEVLVDDWSAQVKAAVARHPREFYAGMLPAAG
jgi:NAD(P)-dependent dehydrogenase (short-subunit alcohol dehydrogenase family)